MVATRSKRSGWGVCSLLVLVLVGCGGSDPKGSGPSLDSQVQRAMSEPNPVTRAQRLVAVAAEQKKAGDNLGAEKSVASALLAAQEIEQPEARADALVHIAGAQARMDRSAEAKQTVKLVDQALGEVAEPELKIPNLLLLAKLYVDHLDSVATAEYYLEQAQEAAASIEVVEARLQAELKVARGYAAAGNQDKAREILDNSVQAVGDLSDARKQADLRITAMLAAHDLEASEQVAQLRKEAEANIASIEDALSRGYARLNLGKALAQLKDSDAAKVLAEAEADANQVGDRSLQEGLVKELNAAKRKAPK